MKKILILLLLSMFILENVFAQNTVYDASHSKKEFTSEEIELSLAKSTVQPGGPQLAPVLVAAIPAVIDFGFKLTTKILEKKVKDYSAEYSKSNSYLEAADGMAPNIILIRKVAFNNGALEPALSITFKPMNAKGTLLQRYIYYQVSELDLVYSSAKSTNSFPTFDYTIELKLDYVVGNEKKVLEMAPIVISSVKYTKSTLPNDKYRTDLIPIPKDGLIVGASIKVVETNPGKVRAEKILSVWNDNKDDVKTIINNFLPKDEEKDDKKTETADATTPVDGDAQSSSNPTPKKKLTKNP